MKEVVDSLNSAIECARGGDIRDLDELEAVKLGAPLLKASMQA